MIQTTDRVRVVVQGSTAVPRDVSRILGSSSRNWRRKRPRYAAVSDIGSLVVPSHIRGLAMGRAASSSRVRSRTMIPASEDSHALAKAPLWDIVEPVDRPQLLMRMSLPCSVQRNNLRSPRTNRQSPLDTSFPRGQSRYEQELAQRWRVP